MTAPSSDQSKIVLSGVTKSFEDNHVLKGIDLDVHAGESLVLIGPSGSGKTVALKCVIGLMNPDAGSIRIDGRETAGLSEGQRTDELARTGMLFQRSALFDSMTIWQNITFRLSQTRDISDQAAREFAVGKLIDVGLAPEVADLYPVELSGGMQKRVGIARAIADEPEMLLLDEPTAGLDPIMTRAINELILENAEKLGATILSITSDMDGARTIADRIAMIYEGRIIWCGPKDEADESGNPYLDQFIHRRSEGPIETLID
jgi:phospholipid/cholesterol/gamma-HCH transport system ATP-binding protein